GGRTGACAKATDAASASTAVAGKNFADATIFISPPFSGFDGRRSCSKALVGLQVLRNRRCGLHFSERPDAHSRPMLEEQAEIVEVGRVARELPAKLLRRFPVGDAPEQRVGD